MKRLLICLSFLTLIAACNELREDSVKEFIPGSYIRFSQHEYGKEYDTLVITIQSKAANDYKIQRKWKYERVLDGVAQEPEFKQEITTALYDNRQHLLNENETGNTISFDPNENVLFIGTTKYKKLK